MLIEKREIESVAQFPLPYNKNKSIPCTEKRSVYSMRPYKKNTVVFRTCLNLAVDVQFALNI
jgi:hypothetical protein